MKMLSRSLLLISLIGLQLSMAEGLAPGRWTGSITGSVSSDSILLVVGEEGPPILHYGDNHRSPVTLLPDKDNQLSFEVDLHEKRHRCALSSKRSYYYKGECKAEEEDGTFSITLENPVMASSEAAGENENSAEGDASESNVEGQ